MSVRWVEFDVYEKEISQSQQPDPQEEESQFPGSVFEHQKRKKARGKTEKWRQVKEEVQWEKTVLEDLTDQPA